MIFDTLTYSILAVGIALTYAVVRYNDGLNLRRYSPDHAKRCNSA